MRFDKIKITFKALALAAFLLSTTSGCTLFQRVLNPFYEPPSDTALFGEKNDSALRGSAEHTIKARQALDSMGQFQRAHDPQPVNPVMRPAVVRLMWIPDHLNKSGDLVPAHYYYLKVLKEDWAVQDAFELEQQLGASTSTSSLPFVYEQR